MAFGNRFGGGGRSQKKPQSRTANSGGTAGAIIGSGVALVKPTVTDAAHVIRLPATVVGHEIMIMPAVDANYELRATGASIKINNTAVTNGAAADTKELLVNSANALHCICTSATTWVVTKITNVGARSAGGTPDGV